MNALSESIQRAQARDPDLLPDLRSATTLIVTSDYGGQHKESDFETYSFLIVPLGSGWSRWEQSRVRIRQAYRLHKRRMSYTTLRDRRRRQALDAFLGAVDAMPGLCMGVLVAKPGHSLFEPDSGADPPDDGPTLLTTYSAAARERLLRIVHLISLFIAGLSRPGQDVLWFTDEDEIAANPSRVRELTEAFGRVSGHYLPHDMGHLRCGTTACDDGTLQIEDLASVPDLVAGALAEVFTAYRRDRTMPVGPIIVRPPHSVSPKARRIAAWLSDSAQPMRRLVYAIKPKNAGTGLVFQRMVFHGMGTG